MTERSDDLADQLRQLAERGEPRGAESVYAAARRAQGGFGARRITAIAAAVMLVAGIAAAFGIDDKDTPTKPTGTFAAGVTTTTTAAAPAVTTTTFPPATRVFLASTRLVAFDKCASVASYARARALDVVGAYGFPYGASGGGLVAQPAAGGVGSGRAEGGATAGDGAAPPASPAPALARTDDNGEFSNTNVQEAGIDEPDTVKTNGKTIFTVANGRVFATSAGESPRVLNAIDDPAARELLLVGSKLVVLSDGGYFGYATNARAIADSSFAPPGSNNPQPSRFSVYDVSDPSNMKFQGSMNFDGSYLSARLVDGVPRLIVRSHPRMTFTYPTDGSPQAQEAAAAANRDIVRNTNNDTWLPHFTTTNAAGKESSIKPLSSCSDTYRPPTLSGFGMLSVITMNLSDPAKSHSASVMAEGDIVYSSASRLYVATNSWNDVVNSQVQPSPTTLIHSFDITNNDAARYLVSGRVRGTVLNQWSLSEHEGVLRVATTDHNGGSESFLTVLQDHGDALQQIGLVSGLGKTERIYGVRYIGTTAYVVTFRQVDPLYVIDVSDPKNPRVTGELKISGYSAYLHPIGPGLLLGIGQEATAEGRQVGFQASVFDVRDPANPKLLTRKIIESAGSSAEFDHKAFLYWPATGLAVVPMYEYGPNGQSFNGAIGLRISESSINEVGRIQQPDATTYGHGIDRSLVIGSRLFTTSFRGVLANRLDNLQSLSWVPYPG